jgi:hypothetical protein
MLYILDFRIAKADLTEETRNENGAEPVATDNDLPCHGMCSEPHIPRQSRSRLTLSVGQKKYD